MYLTDLERSGTGVRVLPVASPIHLQEMMSQQDYPTISEIRTCRMHRNLLSQLALNNSHAWHCGILTSYSIEPEMYVLVAANNQHAPLCNRQPCTAL